MLIKMMPQTNLILALKKLLSLPFLVIIYIYQKAISPLIGPSCRYHPTCSNYAKIAIRKHGVFKGGILSIVRILKCNPFSGYGIDDVPEEFSFLNLFKKSKRNV